ncbi:uncharacterized protein LACBIDRAFT_316135 [Laccaria bicolor S238N-H82]|uniref:Predicted protein n=1 Tax=Laccaria bicolor (strain S238N-H82 / ATCC MYA-4686) TaxID=486041 RepID=B0D227_LACBS|nr:uncharacterized protein LACBIDRAFT_316135 [Laccaria bicolor S238N-H82]EDR11359.1 predicted protein [Laccaria bicolor S238N-H82]|eukprot:XP_001878660.1 predicted protein [Laccaria bicolor S238N-H82]
MGDHLPSSSSKKRILSDTELGGGIRKVAKVHPFFTKSKTTSGVGTGDFQWLSSLGSNGSCLHGVNLNPKSSSKVAIFDLDGTLIKSEFHNKLLHGKPAWEWWKLNVPSKLAELHTSGYALVIVTNQAIKPAAMNIWRQKIPQLAAVLNLPFRIFVAVAKDEYRKPMPGMWNELDRIFNEQGTKIDKGCSFFVGDAAGRHYNGKRSDFSSSDRKWAHNVGLNFFTPEEYFLGQPTYTNFELPGFHVSSIPELPLITPTSSPLLPTPLKQEIVLFVGYPCLGKTSFFRRHFLLQGYEHINQDNLKTRDRCIKALQSALGGARSCVIDNTNRDVSTRAHYINVANAHKVPIRCILFVGSCELAWHNNLYRAYNLPPAVAARELLPYMAFTSFRDNYEEPQSDEGFAEIKKVNWVFEGSEEEKRYWSMWLQIDGK